MHARHYNPQLARFLQIDPLAGSPGQPQTLNRYAYVAGNPIAWIDPEGTKKFSELFNARKSDSARGQLDVPVAYHGASVSAGNNKLPWMGMPVVSITIDVLSRFCFFQTGGAGQVDLGSGFSDGAGNLQGKGEHPTETKTDDKKKDPNKNCTGGEGVTFTHGVGLSLGPVIGVDASVGVAISFRSGFPWIETSLFASGGPTAGWNLSGDVFVGVYSGSAPSLHGETKNLNIVPPPPVPISVTIMADPNSGEPLGATVGYGPSLRGGGANFGPSTTVAWGSEDAYRRWKKGRGDCK